MTPDEWRLRFVQRWSELADGRHDPLATADDAIELHKTHGHLEPEKVAENEFEGTGR